ALGGELSGVEGHLEDADEELLGEIPAEHFGVGVDDHVGRAKHAVLERAVIDEREPGVPLFMLVAHSANLVPSVDGFPSPPSSIIASGIGPWPPATAGLRHGPFFPCAGRRG